MNYLSDTWISAAHQSLSDAASTLGRDRIELLQRIIGARSYVIRIDGQQASLESHDGAVPGEHTLSFEQDWATACDIAQGRTAAHQAFLLGDITFTGDISILIANAGLLDQIESALAPVMSQTTFPEHFTA